MSLPPPGDINVNYNVNIVETTSRRHLHPGQSPVYVMSTGSNTSGDVLEWDSDVFNDVLEDFRASLYTYGQPSTIVLLCFYVPIFLLALSGNVLVTLIIVGNKNMRSVTNYFLLNLAIADLLGQSFMIHFYFIEIPFF